MINSFSQKPDELHIIYEQQMEWARHFNLLIWMIGSILLPATFVGLAFEFADCEIFLLSMIGSILLLLFWWLFAEWHRRLWKRAFTCTGIIEALWGYREKSDDPKELEKHLLSFITPHDWGWWLRHIIVVVGIIMWGFRCYIRFTN